MLIAREQPATADPLADFSLEITSREAEKLSANAGDLAPGSAVSIAVLGTERPGELAAAAATIQAAGLAATPHIAARRLASHGELASIAAALRASGVSRAFVVAGDLDAAHGPFGDAVALLETGLLAEHGIGTIGIAGYPEGHPKIAAMLLDQAMRSKLGLIAAAGQRAEIYTQFTFSAAPILDWLDALRQSGVDSLVRIGVPGPAGLATLARYASTCGVQASARVLAKYGASMARAVNAAGPDRLLGELGDKLDPARHGDTAIHFFPFGAPQRTLKYAAAFRERA